MSQQQRLTTVANVGDNVDRQAIHPPTLHLSHIKDGSYMWRGVQERLAEVCTKMQPARQSHCTIVGDGRRHVDTLVANGT